MIWYTQLLLFIIWIRIYGRLLHHTWRTFTRDAVIVSTAMKYSNENNRYGDNNNDNKFNVRCTRSRTYVPLTMYE